MSPDDKKAAKEPGQEFQEWREREKKLLEYLEDITSHPLEEQEKLLKHILEKNAKTAYLLNHGMNGATDVDSFRKRLPVANYDLLKEYVDLVVEGDNSPLLSVDPACEIVASSGTSGGDPKLFPVTEEDLNVRGLVWSLMRPVLNRALPGLEKGKAMFFYFIRPPVVSQNGVPSISAVTSFIQSSAFKQRPFDPTYRLTSPDEVIECFDSDAAMYCHLLLGLLQREEVLRCGAIFASLLLKSLRALEDLCSEICEDIAHGTLSSRVKDDAVRSAVLPFLRKDPELADFVRNEFAPGKSTDGIVRRIWPNVKVIDTVCTGSMEAYLPALANWSNNLPVICTQLYAATEGYFGINLNPLCAPEEICYTLIPSVAYYEFIAVSADSNKKLGEEVNEILGLLDVSEGQEYELIVTTVSGLYRYRMEDVLKVVGFYNLTPVFQFIRRMNVVLSIDTDKTDEKELLSGVSRGAKFLESQLGFRLLDYTSTTDISTNPGHYVIFWELIHPSSEAPTQEVLEQCCSLMEADFNYIYRRERHHRNIGALELRLVQEGTFDLLAKYAIARGASISQYKIPRGLSSKSASLIEILNSRVSKSVFSQDKPPFVSSASGQFTLKGGKSQWSELETKTACPFGRIQRRAIGLSTIRTRTFRISDPELILLEMVDTFFNDWYPKRMVFSPSFLADTEYGRNTFSFSETPRFHGKWFVLSDFHKHIQPVHLKTGFTQFCHL